MIWFFVGLFIGSNLGFFIGAILTSGKMFDEAQLAYNEGYRVGKSEK